MCGRFVLSLSTVDIIKKFAVDKVLGESIPSYNIAPTQMVSGIVNDGSNCLVQFQWGLIPSWAKDPSIGSKMINARAETLSGKPSFKKAFKQQRCLIISDGFYEWRKDGKAKTPYFIRLKAHELFGFAGLFDIWTSSKGEKTKSCTIITTESNELLKPVHSRMPVIIPKDDEPLWLNPAMQNEKQIFPVLKQYPSEKMECYEVSKTVNSPANNSPDCIKPV